jgi:LmbE family N-acetylglucosaminyl deacetylase
VAEAPTGSPLGEHLYKSDEELFGPLHSAEDPLVGQLSALLSASTPKNAAIVCPLAVGGHADHRLTRAAAEASGKRLKYYIDFPYILRDFGPIEELNEQAWQSRLFQVTQAGFEAWYEAIAAHQSQISTFWEDLPQMRAELEAYHAKFGGIRLWEPPFQENPHRGPGDK